MAEHFLNDQIVGQVRQVFERLQEPVQLLFFNDKNDCDFCADTQQLLEEVTAISDKLGLTVFDLETDAEVARQYHVDKAPGLVLAGKKDTELIDFGIRYSGIPSGHEFSSLIHSLVLVSGRDSQLRQQTRDFLAGLKEPVHLQVFVTPT